MAQKGEKMQSKYKKLLSNSFLFLAAQFGSKVMMLLVVPLYTYILTTSEYGAIEVSTATLTIAAPCYMLLIYDAVLRFNMSEDTNKKCVLTSALKVFLGGSVVALTIIPILQISNSTRQYAGYVYLLIVSYSLFYIFSQFVKGLNSKVFLMGGIIYTFIFLTSNVYLIAFLKRGVEGYLLSQIVAYFLATLYCVVRMRAWRFVDFRLKTKNISKQMLKYSVLLIPNALVWWVIASANRYFIEAIISDEANGIYGVAAKIPNIITMVGTIFIQAWQLSAIEEKESNEDLVSRKKFFTSVFDLYSAVLVIGSSILIMFCKPLLSVLSTEFYDAWKYVPVLLLASIYMMYAQYWSSLFVAEKSSKELSSSSVIAGITSLILNFWLIPQFGLLGATIACFISCFIMWVIRIYAARKYNMINVSFIRELVVLVILIIQCVLVLLLANRLEVYVVNILLFGVIIIIYRRQMIASCRMVKSVLGKINRRKKYELND